jgi:hypothetical protein
MLTPMAGAAMRSFPEFGIWTCAGLYIAIGVIGVFCLGAKPNTVSSTDGYGIVQVSAQAAPQGAAP